MVSQEPSVGPAVVSQEPSVGPTMVSQESSIGPIVVNQEPFTKASPRIELACHRVRHGVSLPPPYTRDMFTFTT
ncbi:hypothetical protein E2542_SST02301 [Spatholobus suberectus]|nr:hypothetical protein E2542_SST02301 [Spatholobus suberectus]